MTERPEDAEDFHAGSVIDAPVAAGDPVAAEFEEEGDRPAGLWRASFTPQALGRDWSLWRGRWAVVLMMLCAALAGPIGYAGQLGYAALLGVAGIASLPLLGVTRPPMVLAGVLLALAVWAVVTMGWSVAMPHPAVFHKYKQVEGLTAIKLVLELALYGAFAFLIRELPEGWANRIMVVLALSLTLIAVLMAIDAFTGCGVYRALRLAAHADASRPELIRPKAARGCYTLALLFWPVALWMRRTGWNLPLVIFCVGFAVAAVGLNVDAPIAAVALGGLVMLAVRRFGSRAIWVLIGLVVLYFALTPLLVDQYAHFIPAMHNESGVAKESWSARVGIWRFTSGLIVQRPWQGWGIDASRVFAPIPLHPHNMVLQLWFELGAAGAALGALFWALLLGRIGVEVETSRSDAGVAAAVVVAYLVIGGLSFGIWQEWWLALGVLAVAVHRTFSLAFRDWDEAALDFGALRPL